MNDIFEIRIIHCEKLSDLPTSLHLWPVICAIPSTSGDAVIYEITLEDTDIATVYACLEVFDSLAEACEELQSRGFFCFACNFRELKPQTSH